MNPILTNIIRIALGIGIDAIERSEGKPIETLSEADVERWDRLYRERMRETDEIVNSRLRELGKEPLDDPD